MIRLIFLILTLSLPATGLAQTSRRDSIRMVVKERALMADSLLAQNYNKVNYDTAFIGRPQKRLTLKARLNVSGSAFHVKGHGTLTNGKSDISTDNKATLSLGVNYRGITAGLALNPAKLKGKNKDFELNLNSYSNRYGFDVVYQVSKTLAGEVAQNGTPYMLSKGMVNMKMLSINAYYAFNGKRFSYPAAFTQSYIQRRSAGSWLAGFSFLGGSLKSTDNVPEGFPKYRNYLGFFGIGGGYGYNLVLGKSRQTASGTIRDWLIHISAMPTLVINNLNNVKINGERKDMQTEFPDLILAERLAVVRNFSDKYFAGATLVMTNSLLGDNKIDINYRKWRSRLFFGIRL